MALTRLTRGEVNEELAAALHKDLEVPDDALDVTRFRKNAFAFLEVVHTWHFLHAHSGQLTLTVSTKELALPANFQRVDRDSICIYGSDPDADETLTYFDAIAEIDRHLGRGWKRSGHAGGRPQFATLMGDSLWVGPAPNAAAITARPYLDFYYYQGIDPSYTTVRVAEALSAAADDTALNAPTYMLPYISWSAQQLGQLQEDNDAYATLMSRFRSEILPEIRGFDPSTASYEPVARPRLGGGRGYMRRRGY